MTSLLPELVFRHATQAPDRIALIAGDQHVGYEELAQQIRAFSSFLLEYTLGPAQRVGVFLDKRVEAVVAMFGASTAGCVFVPINPLYRQRHVRHILRDCNVRVLVTSRPRLAALGTLLDECPDLRSVIVVNDGTTDGAAPGPEPAECRVELADWQIALAMGADSARTPYRRISEDMTAIFYTSGSTGMPKGVVLSHRNFVAGAASVASYLENREDDRLLAALPLSFDAGFSQLTTAFTVGATVVLLNYLMPRDVVNAVSNERITGLTGVPPLFIKLSQVDWPREATTSLRYIASTGGVMPRQTLKKLRGLLPETRIFLMYGLTEAFRSTYLPAEQVDRRPDSIGKAIPNAEILVVNKRGTLCGPGEEGELVHRGPLVSLGYWNDPQRTAERFRPAPAQASELCLPDIAVWSGDTVRTDDDGYLYFVGRRDELIKTSGNRVSPTEVEEVVYGSGLAGDAVAVGAPHPSLGQGIVVVASSRNKAKLDIDGILDECRRQLPAFMVPLVVLERSQLPLNANGKIDRSLLQQEVKDIFQKEI